jgi:hypothetical protein
VCAAISTLYTRRTEPFPAGIFGGTAAHEMGDASITRIDRTWIEVNGAIDS